MHLRFIFDLFKWSWFLLKYIHTSNKLKINQTSPKCIYNKRLGITTYYIMSKASGDKAVTLKILVVF